MNATKMPQNKARILKISRVLRTILLLGLVFSAIGIPVVLYRSAMFWTRPPAIDRSTALGLQGSLLLVQTFRFLLCVYLFRFFDQLKNGHLFDAKTVGYLGAAGKWWVVLFLFEVVRYEVGHELFKDLSGWCLNFDGLAAGLTLIFVAWLLKEGQELKDEQALTI